MAQRVRETSKNRTEGNKGKPLDQEDELLIKDVSSDSSVSIEIESS